MKFHFDNKMVMIGFSIAMVVLIILGVFSYSSMQRLKDAARLQSHTTYVLSTADQIIRDMVDMETGQRGYVITGKEEFLQPFFEASTLIDTHLVRLDSLTLEDPGQQKRIDTLRGLIIRQVRWTRSVIDTRMTSAEEAHALVAAGEGKRNTDGIRQVIKLIQQEERVVLASSNPVTNDSVQRFQYSFIALSFTIFITVAYLFYILNANFKVRNEVEKELQRVATDTRDLYDNAPVGYHSLDKDGTIVDINQTELNWLGYSRDEVVGKLNFKDLLTEQSKQIFKTAFSEFKETGSVSELELELIKKDGSTMSAILNSTSIKSAEGEYLRSRSTVIDNTERKKSQTRILDLNQELEGFTYSVSHDLRAPLRSIIGYSNILKEEYYEKMDEEAKRIIDVIIRNTVRMGQLIDDLLDFSRLGRKQVTLTAINMKETVENIVREQTAELKDRKIAIKILELEPAKGDIAMIRQVWINLVANALKYSSKKELAQIEIGSFRKDGKKVYYITDNGAGFDMKYADKLFGVFQRLHKMNEFEGTGVGLALVKTIVKRHGGDIWAEGKVNEGAKFYFTLI